VGVRGGQQYHAGTGRGRDADGQVQFTGQVRVEFSVTDVLVTAVEATVHQLPPVEADDRHVRVVGDDPGAPPVVPVLTSRVVGMGRAEVTDVGQPGDAAALDRPVAHGDAGMRRKVRADGPGHGVAEDGDPGFGAGAPPGTFRRGGAGWSG